MKKTGIIIQARMTSNRFPGKVVAMLDNKPVLAHVIERCLSVPFVANVIVATPMGEAQSAIEFVTLTCSRNWEAKNNLPFTRQGSPLCHYAPYVEENDVSARYYETAKFFKFDNIVRITADCPFLDPTIISIALTMLQDKKLDYVSNVYPDRTFPKGLDVEAFTFDCLEAAHQLAETAYDREHVTSVMQNTDEIKKGLVSNKNDQSKTNWCVDWPADIERLEKVITLYKTSNKLIDIGIKRQSNKNKIIH